MPTTVTVSHPGAGREAPQPPPARPALHPDARRRPRRHLRRDERGEGVISAAIAVLIMAFIGVGMWVAFNTTFQHTAKNVDNQVNCIGQTSC
jgi:hypothetical protein